MAWAWIRSLIWRVWPRCSNQTPAQASPYGFSAEANTLRQTGPPRSWGQISRRFRSNGHPASERATFGDELSGVRKETVGAHGTVKALRLEGTDWHGTLARATPSRYRQCPRKDASTTQLSTSEALPDLLPFVSVCRSVIASRPCRNHTGYAVLLVLRHGSSNPLPLFRRVLLRIKVQIQPRTRCFFHPNENKQVTLARGQRRASVFRKIGALIQNKGVGHGRTKEDFDEVAFWGAWWSRRPPDRCDRHCGRDQRTDRAGFQRSRRLSRPAYRPRARLPSAFWPTPHSATKRLFLRMRHPVRWTFPSYKAR